MLLNEIDDHDGTCTYNKNLTDMQHWEIIAKLNIDVGYDKVLLRFIGLLT